MDAARRYAVGGWLQILVLVNPLVYMSEGFRAALTTVGHMSLWAVYPALIGFTAFFRVARAPHLQAARDQLTRRPAPGRSLLSSSRPAGWRSG